MKLEFKPEDFDSVFTKEAQLPIKLAIAQVTNARLKEMLKKAPVVHCNKRVGGPAPWWIDPAMCHLERPTHRARLVEIEEL